MGEALKNIDKTKKWFMANGNKYIIHETLSIERFLEFEKRKLEFDLNITLLMAKKNFVSIYQKLNEGKMADAAVIAHNMTNAIDMMEKKEFSPVFHICALFICRVDEDIRKLDRALQDEKIRDWAEEGYDYADFFYLASTLSNNFTPDFGEDSQSISLKQEEKKEI